MYLVIDIERNFMLGAYRDMQLAYAVAEASESKGVATQVKFVAGFRRI